MGAGSTTGRLGRREAQKACRRFEWAVGCRQSEVVRHCLQLADYWLLVTGAAKVRDLGILLCVSERG